MGPSFSLIGSEGASFAELSISPGSKLLNAASAGDMAKPKLRTDPQTLLREGPGRKAILGEYRRIADLIPIFSRDISVVRLSDDSRVFGNQFSSRVVGKDRHFMIFSPAARNSWATQTKAYATGGDSPLTIPFRLSRSSLN